MTKQVFEMIHCMEGCRTMTIKQCQDGAIGKRHTKYATTTCETVKARQCREVDVLKQE